MWQLLVGRAHNQESILPEGHTLAELKAVDEAVQVEYLLQGLQFDDEPNVYGRQISALSNTIGAVVSDFWPEESNQQDDSSH